MPNPRISAELGLFLRDYGLRGDDGLNLHKLRWRVFEGYGNHDFDVLERFSLLYDGKAPAVEVVSVRNQVRSRWPEMRRFAAQDAGHYSWDWDDVHLVQLNLAPADRAAASGVQQPRDPAGRAGISPTGSRCRDRRDLPAGHPDHALWLRPVQPGGRAGGTRPSGRSCFRPSAPTT